MNIKNNKGFSLIEVLITALIVSFSLLGVGALQLKTHQFNTSASFQSYATILAHDMIERMRSNPVGIKNANYHLPTATQHSDCHTAVGCSTSEMAENDMYEWAGNGMHSIRKVLPAGRAVVCIDSTPNDGIPSSAACDKVGSIYAIKIWWSGIDATQQRFVTTVGF